MNYKKLYKEFLIEYIKTVLIDLNDEFINIGNLANLVVDLIYDNSLEETEKQVLEIAQEELVENFQQQISFIENL